MQFSEAAMLPPSIPKVVWACQGVPFYKIHVIGRSLPQVQARDEQFDHTLNTLNSAILLVFLQLIPIQPSTTCPKVPHPLSQVIVLWNESDPRSRQKNLHAYSASRQRQSSGHNLRTQQAFPGAHRATRVHPLLTCERLFPTPSVIHTNNECDLEFANTITYGDKFASAPHETFHRHRAHGVFQRFHIGLVVPRFDLEGDDRLGNGFSGGRQGEEKGYRLWQLSWVCSPSWQHTPRHVQP
jgi:hypothetical protein